jgi:hypothetical protein
LEQEEIKWSQRARANWLQHDDKNMAYFQGFASARGKKNFIKTLKNENGQFVEGTENLNPVVVNYFTNLFSLKVNVTDPAFTDKITPKVTCEMNDKLIAPYAAEDAKKAVFSIGDLKAPGPDGIHPLFYKKNPASCGNRHYKCSP